MLSENTINISFKNLQYKLQDNNIENCFFMNQTIDSSLNDLDVYKELYNLRNKQADKNLLLDKIKAECACNIWYYFREVVRLPDKYHIELSDSNNLSMFPINSIIAKMIYLYDNNYSSVIITNNNKDLLYLTLCFLAIREEFILNNSGNNRLFISFDDHAEELGFKECMQSCLWAINDIIGSIDGITPIHQSSTPWQFKSFKKQKNNKAVICPYINTDDDVMNFLKLSRKLNNERSIGRLNVNENMRSFNILNNFVMDDRFFNGDILFDIPKNNIDKSKVYKI